MVSECRLTKLYYRFPQEAEINERDRKDYFTPSTNLFSDYCDSIAARYGLDEGNPIRHSDVCDIRFGEIEGSKDDTRLFTVCTSHGENFHSRAVVLAVGPGHTKMMPWGELSSEEKMGACHSSEVGGQFPSPALARKIENRQATNLVIIGGGLSSAQIADMVIRNGVTKVWLLMRGDLKIKHFDVSLNWVGKFKNYDKAVFWSADDDQGKPFFFIFSYN